MTTSLVILYLSVLVGGSTNYDVQLHPISRYEKKAQCEEHKKYVVRSMKKQGTYDKSTMIFFCTPIKYNNDNPEIFSYVPKIPFCKKQKKSVYFCGYPL